MSCNRYLTELDFLDKDTMTYYTKGISILYHTKSIKQGSVRHLNVSVKQKCYIYDGGIKMYVEVWASVTIMLLSSIFGCTTDDL